MFMKTSAISLIEKKPHRDGGTYDHLKSLEVYLIPNEARTILLQEVIEQNEFPVLLQIQNQQPIKIQMGIIQCLM